MANILAESKAAERTAGEEREKVAKSAALLLSSVMEKVPAEAKDMAGKRRNGGRAGHRWL